jgi:hypothetical protein
VLELSYDELIFKIDVTPWSFDSINAIVPPKSFDDNNGADSIDLLAKNTTLPVKLTDFSIDELSRNTFVIS